MVNYRPQLSTEQGPYQHCIQTNHPTSKTQERKRWNDERQESAGGKNKRRRKGWCFLILHGCYRKLSFKCIDRSNFWRETKFFQFICKYVSCVPFTFRAHLAKLGPAYLFLLSVRSINRVTQQSHTIITHVQLQLVSVIVSLFDYL